MTINNFSIWQRDFKSVCLRVQFRNQRPVHFPAVSVERVEFKWPYSIEALVENSTVEFGIHLIMKLLMF